MKNLFSSILILISILGVQCQSERKMTTPENAEEQFQIFLNKEKFVKEDNWPGISDQTLKPILSEKINEVALEFQKLALSKNPTYEGYQKAIKEGLKKFPENDLGYDSEDRERILLYFQEIMDIVKLESSDGQLNDFYYGFNPN